MGLVDRSMGKAISLTLWESEAEALASGAGSAYMQAALAKFASLFVAAPVIETYEVGLQE
jgi:quinol monooxygenase YgiN